LRELRRVTKGPVVIFTYDPESVAEFWLSDYVPEMVEIDKMRYPTIEYIVKTLGGSCAVQNVPVPRD
jgi:hypothetical protein